jgi:hypothetical protein
MNDKPAAGTRGFAAFLGDELECPVGVLVGDFADGPQGLTDVAEGELARTIVVFLIECIEAIFHRILAASLEAVGDFTPSASELEFGLQQHDVLGIRPRGSIQIRK